MKIKYYLIENLMTPAPDDCRAQVTGYESVTEKEIIEYITRKGSSITPAAVKANYEEIIGAHEYFLQQGYGVNTEFLNVRPAIQGVFRDKDDKFDPARHRIRFRATLGKRYNRTSDEVKTEKTEPVVNAPLPQALEDIASATVNETVTPGGTATLTGVRLKFRQDDPQQGIFLIAPDKTERRVERILSHNAAQVVFLIPADLPADEYSLEVRILLKGSKEIKKGTLPDKLTANS
ncbi:MAG: DUF4469 domain-containing protein [Bacteroidales bacterium]|jgi:hypothetical protein|nr:DUF4469 domain-containing protein [Bacteroidales bacterium]